MKNLILHFEYLSSHKLCTGADTNGANATRCYVGTVEGTGLKCTKLEWPPGALYS